MTKEQALTRISSALAKIPHLRDSYGGSAEHVEFVQTTGLDLARIFGPDSPVTRNFSAITYQGGGFLASYWTYEQDLARNRREAFESGLDAAEGILRSAQEQLTEFGADEVLRRSRLRSDGARVFVSHGGESNALSKLERFLRALGVTPVIVAREPSEGMSLDSLVEKRLGECDCAIILATADDEVEGRWQPRPNVLHEIGLAQERLSDTVIYLREEKCEFPSNVRPKVWENFTQENMDAAFEKVVKELRAFGLT